MKFIKLCFSVCLLFSISSQAQYFSWANRLPGIDHAHQTSMALDAQSNVYVTGWFQDAVDFDPDTGVFILTSIPNGDDIFLAAYNAEGKFKWANRFGTASYDQGISVKIDHSGNVLLAALFQSSSDFDPGPNTYNLSSNGGYDFVIAKYDSLGNFIWANSFGGISDEAKIQIDVDAANNVYAVGDFSSTVDFDPSSTGTFNITSAFAEDIFISKLDSNGNFVWAKSITGTTGPEEANAMDVQENGTIYFTGRADGGLGTDWDPGTGVFHLPYTIMDPYVTKLDSAGNFLWANQFIVPGLNTSIGQALKCDAAGNVFTAGQFADSIDLNPDSAANFIIHPIGNWDTYISKLDSSGNFVWGKSIGGSANDYAYAMTLDQAGNVYTSGQFSGICDFNPDTNIVYNIQSNGFNSPDMFTLKLDNAGNFQWAFNIGGIYTDEGNSIAVDNQDNIFVNGKFGGLVDFNPDTNATYDLSSASYYTLFLMKLSQCMPQFTTLNQIACDSFEYNGATYYSSGAYQHLFQGTNGCDSMVTLNLNIANNDSDVFVDACSSFYYDGQTYTTSGIYYHTLSNIFGCDSNVTLHLTVTAIDTTIWQSGTYLQSNFLQSGATFQWIDCNTGAWIPFEDNVSFDVTTPGSYGVIITYNNCVDTSECINVTNVGINENHFLTDVQISPNPASGIFKVESSGSLKNCIVKIYNSLGDMIFVDELKNQNIIDIRNKPDGLYLVRVMMNEKEIAKNRLYKIN